MDRQSVIKSLLVLLVALSCMSGAHSQEPVFENRVDTGDLKKTFGPNRKNYFHPIFSASLFLPVNYGEDRAAFLPSSLAMQGGFLYKRKLAEHLAVVLDLKAEIDRFVLSRSTGSGLEADRIFKSSLLTVGGFGGGGYLRIRTGQRGNYLGQYFDLGMAAMVPVANALRQTFRVKEESIPDLWIEEARSVSIHSLRPFQYWMVMRIGFDKFDINLGYRISGAYKQTASERELPPFFIGVGYSPVRY